MIEGNYDFEFDKRYSSVIKFDDTPFYRQYFNKLPKSKGVDFLALGKNDILLLEVKDCKGMENENRWRIFPDNKKWEKSSTKTNTEGRDSLDIEVAEKVAMTLACLVGAATKQTLGKQNRMDEGGKFFSILLKSNLPSIRIILFLTGDFSTHSRTSKMILKSLTDSIKKKLSWLECKVFVENEKNQKAGYYTVKIKEGDKT